MKEEPTHIQTSVNGKVLSAAISAVGAELQSLRLNSEASANNKEYLWQGTPQVWSGRAPILFPVIGALRHTPTLYKKRELRLEKHGFARNSLFELVQANESSAVFQLGHSAATLTNYPWQFLLQVHFALNEEVLSIRYQLQNLDKEPLLFNLGSHPAFNLPMHSAVHSDYSIQFEKEEALQLHAVTAEGLLTRSTTAYPLVDRCIPLSETIFANDALVFRNIASEKITLAHNTEGPVLTVDTGGAPHLGIWAKPGAHYVCIEPWWGHADFDNASNQFEQKSSIQRLEPGAAFETSIKIKLHI